MFFFNITEKTASFQKTSVFFKDSSVLFVYISEIFLGIFFKIE